MTNWPTLSLRHHVPSPVEVDGGLLFHPDHWREASASAERVRANGMAATVWTCPRDLGVFVEVNR